jgi:2-keto-4-pentenoate hydratase/2-oxohepta-3-ene-1,7-dioic acid hydratase in catechol pathway
MSIYQHLHQSGHRIDLPVGKVVCVGRNYVDHIQELNNNLPEQPMLFMKPSTALCHFRDELTVPDDRGECHNELEIAILVGSPLSKATVQQAQQAIWGYGLALDLTLRDLQSQLKEQGHPWEKAKAFDLSCPVSGFIPRADIKNEHDIQFSLHINNALRQSGNSINMIYPIHELLVEISQHFSLMPGDIVLTGTPKGVGALQNGDQLTAQLNDQLHVHAQVVNA